MRYSRRISGILLLSSWSWLGCAHPTHQNGSPSASPEAEPTAWIEATQNDSPGGLWSLRALALAGGDCPTATIDDKPAQMKKRPSSDPAAFAVAACETDLPPGARTIHVGTQQLQAPHPDPRKIVLLGDTGCRIKTGSWGSAIQECNDPRKWPFARIARAAAAWHPDLILHLGDYHYREFPCPAGNKTCEGITPGDNWPSWNEDLFSPARELLASAPWVMVRGNHELCDRGGKGWFQYLETTHASTAPCEDRTPPRLLPMGDHDLWVVDAADARNIQPALDGWKPRAGRKTWILLHRPVLTRGADAEATRNTRIPPAFLRPGALGAVFSGHLHRLSLNQFSDQRPPELIIGNGGSQLDPWPENSPLGPLELTETGAGVRSLVYRGFGFATLERKSRLEWELLLHDTEGKTLSSCRLIESPRAKTRLKCKP